jgi:hypothetical protein
MTNSSVSLVNAIKPEAKWICHEDATETLPGLVTIRKVWRKPHYAQVWLQ